MPFFVKWASPDHKRLAPARSPPFFEQYISVKGQQETRLELISKRWLLSLKANATWKKKKASILDENQVCICVSIWQNHIYVARGTNWVINYFG